MSQVHIPFPCICLYTTQFNYSSEFNTETRMHSRLFEAGILVSYGLYYSVYKAAPFMWSSYFSIHYVQLVSKLILENVYGVRSTSGMPTQLARRLLETHLEGTVLFYVRHIRILLSFSNSHSKISTPLWVRSRITLHDICMKKKNLQIFVTKFRLAKSGLNFALLI